MSWAGNIVQALRQIILMEERVQRLSEQVKLLADAYKDLDHRLTRTESKLEFIEHLATRAPVLPPKTRR